MITNLLLTFQLGLSFTSTDLQATKIKNKCSTLPKNIIIKRYKTFQLITLIKIRFRETSTIKDFREATISLEIETIVLEKRSAERTHLGLRCTNST